MLSTLSRNKSFVLLIAVYSCLLILVLIPIWTTEYLPLQDYPNHMARMHIINHIDSDTYLQKYYNVKFDILPNLAMDVIVPLLSKLFTLEVAGKLMISLVFIIITSGSVFLNYALFGDHNYWPLTSFLLLFNEAFIKGFVNFLFGVGFALWCIGAWVLMRKRSAWTRITLFAILSSALFFCHLYAFCFYAVVIGTYELTIILKNKDLGFKRSLLQLLITCTQFIIPITFYYLSAPAGSLSKLTYATIYTKLFHYPFHLLSNYAPLLDKVTLVSLVLLIIVGLSSKRLKINNAIILPISILLIIYFCLPRNLSTGANTDWRLLMPLTLLALSGMHLLADKRVFSIAVSIILMLLLTLNVHTVTKKWAMFQDEYKEIMTLIENIEEGSRIYTIRAYSSYREECYPFMHAPTYAAIKRSAFIPSLFALSTQQPVRFNEENVPVMQQSSSPICPGYDASMYQAVDWDSLIKQYDYVLVGKEELLQEIPRSSMNKLYKGENYALYKTKSLHVVQRMIAPERIKKSIY